LSGGKKSFSPTIRAVGGKRYKWVWGKAAVVISLSSRYNRTMKVKSLHSWQVTTAQAFDIQLRLASQVSRTDQLAGPHFIAGVDISVDRVRGVARGAVVVLSYPELKLVETRVVSGKVDFPYVPGLLSFREAPLTLAAFERLETAPDLVLFDGQGIAHPRRLGLAAHLGLFLDTPAIGCAKSRLCGRHDTPGLAPGSYAELVDGGEVIGAALRTKLGTNPVYVSIGHKIDLEGAIDWVMRCCRGYRLPEPTRLAHLAAGGKLGSREAPVPAADYQGRLFE
jgi:deoxyribonuclease V